MAADIESVPQSVDGAQRRRESSEDSMLRNTGKSLCDRSLVPLELYSPIVYSGTVADACRHAGAGCKGSDDT